MYSLAQSARMKGAAGEPLPTPFKGLARLDADFRRGEFSIVAAGAGTGKSLFAMNLATHGNFPVMYFSADSNAATQLSRAAALITGDPIKAVKQALLSDDFDAYNGALEERWWMRFNYNSRPSPAEMEMHLLCYHAVYGTFPHLVIVDNISNVDSGDAGDAGQYSFSLESICEFLSEMARETNAHVLALHHVVGEYADGLTPVPQSGLKGKISRVPSLVLTIHKEIDGMDSRTLYVSPVKNREGFEDSSGGTSAPYDLDPRTMRLKDVEHAT
ncbi:AAA family ATPase [Embleya hyalina]|uniref:Uncharacterized protein n=1 Tax=Embleya hyalina TaxID=516124 RepID=A0A401YZ26_9ACTN|nr:DnaB-like helicase C-terminal domain-containing protein [Embleya hyalina]GCD99847.1 hypothetical protein EHYA_07569 [Embleya hyalina]